jgi:hypothetical protein
MLRHAVTVVNVVVTMRFCFGIFMKRIPDMRYAENVDREFL